MFAQLPPFALQRVQKKLKSLGLFLQSPLWPVRTWPTWGAPVIVGDVFGCGFACGAARPEPAKMPSAPTTTALSVAPERPPISSQRFLEDVRVRIGGALLICGQVVAIASAPERSSALVTSAASANGSNGFVT